MPERVEDEIIDLLGCKREEILRCSAKTGEGVTEVLDAIINTVPAPVGDPDAPLQCLVFDSVFNSFRGIIAYFKVVNGTMHSGDKVRFVNTGKEYDADEIGVLKLGMQPTKEISAGNVGYIISGIKTSTEVKVGDTLGYIEAMKTYNAIRADFDGILTAVVVNSGDSVEEDDVIMKVQRK